jgi:hypothetical protein
MRGQRRPQHSVESEGQTRNGIREDRRCADAKLGGDDLVVAFAVVANVRDVCAIEVPAANAL